MYRKATDDNDGYESVYDLSKLHSENDINSNIKNGKRLL